MKIIWKILIGVLIIFFLFVGGVVYYFSPVMNKFPELSGSYKVGTFVQTWKDDNRQERDDEKNKASDSDDKKNRRLSVQVWYPTDDSTGIHHKYMSDKFHLIKSALYRKCFIPYFITDALLNIDTHSFEDASFSIKEKKYPVVILSPAYNMTKDMYTSTTEALASNGYIVIGVDHPYVSGVAVFDRYDYVTASPRGKLLRNEVNIISEDVSFVIDKLKSMNADKNSSLYEKCDMEKVAYINGGFGDSISCDEENLKAVVYLDSSSIQIDPNKKSKVPTLLFNVQDVSRSVKHQDYLLSRLKGDSLFYFDGRYQITFFGLTDLALLKSFLGRVSLIPSKLVYMNSKTSIGYIINAFFARHVKKTVTQTDKVRSDFYMFPGFHKEPYHFAQHKHDEILRLEGKYKKIGVLEETVKK